MTLPLVQKNTYKSQDLSGGRLLWKDIQNGSNQKAPFNVDTAYNRIRVQVVYDDGKLPGAETGHDHPNSFSGYTLTQVVRNSARARFVDKLGQASQLGSTLTTELRQSWGTVVSGVTTALHAARAVRRGDLVEAAKLLGFSPPVVRRTIVRSTQRRGRTRYRNITTDYWVMPNGRYVAKGAANKWLWYSYGVKPLAQDIYNAMDVLTRDPPSTIVRGNAAGSEALSALHYLADLKVSVRVQAHVRVGNPNLWLANQLGLLNPAQWLLEGIPFSFVVDWFSNLSQIVMQMTDFAGLVITKPNTTSKYYIFETSWVLDENNVAYYMKKFSSVFARRQEIPEAKLVFAYERFNWQRGLNAISLLVGFLKDASHATKRSSF